LKLKRIIFLSKVLYDCHSSISCLKIANNQLNVKVVKLNECHTSTSSLEHVFICNRCKDVYVDSCVANVANIVSLNDKIAKLNAQVKICNYVLKKLKFARGANTSGRL
jgi:hypothetical protein